MVESYQENRGRKETYDQQEVRRNQEHVDRLQKLNEKLESDLIQVGNFVETSITQISQALSSPEMAELRATNPAEWAAKDQEMRNMVAGLQQGYQAAHQKAMGEIEAHRQEFRRQEAQKIKAKYPDWETKERWSNQKRLLAEFGISDAEAIQWSGDSRFTFIVNELADTRAELKALKAEKAKGTVAAQRVKTEKPPLLRKRGPDGRFVAEQAGETQTQGRGKVSRKGLQQAMKRLQQNKDMSSAVDVAKRRLFAVQ